MNARERDKVVARTVSGCAMLAGAIVADASPVALVILTVVAAMALAISIWR